MKRRGVELWTVRSGQLDLLRAAIEGERSHDESQRKTQATRAGLKRRKERGAPVGPVPLGYTVEPRVVDGTVLTARVPDPTTAATVERVFDLVEKGCTFGEVARILNDEGVRTRPRKGAPQGKPFVARTVRELVHNRAYVGEKGYPKLIEPERFDRIHAGLRRLDPTQVAKRRGGRKPVDDSYLLRGVAFCRHCGATMFTRSYASGRHYICGNVRQATGICSASRIPAPVVEGHVLTHLNVFVGGVEAWITEQVEQRDGEQKAREMELQRERGRLADLDRQRDRHLAEYRALIAEGGSGLARIALEEVERIDGDRERQRQAISEAEAVIGEWAGPPDIDAALDFYDGLVELVRGQVAHAEGAEALNRAPGPGDRGALDQPGRRRVARRVPTAGHRRRTCTDPGAR